MHELNVKRQIRQQFSLQTDQRLVEIRMTEVRIHPVVGVVGRSIDLGELFWPDDRRGNTRWAAHRVHEAELGAQEGLVIAAIMRPDDRPVVAAQVPRDAQPWRHGVRPEEPQSPKSPAVCVHPYSQLECQVSIQLPSVLREHADTMWIGIRREGLLEHDQRRVAIVVEVIASTRNALGRGHAGALVLEAELQVVMPTPSLGDFASEHDREDVSAATEIEVTARVPRRDARRQVNVRKRSRARCG